MLIFTRVGLTVLIIMFFVVLCSAAKNVWLLDGVGKDNVDLLNKYEMLREFNSFPLGESDENK